MGMMTFSSFTFFNFSSYFTSLALLTSFYSIYFVLISANVSGFDSLIQLLPSSASLRNAIRKSETIFRVDDFGAVGDGFTDDTNSFKDVWHMACSSPSRSKIAIPTGYVFLVRPINFGGPCRSKVSLRIEGTILAPKDPEVWNGLNPRRWLYFFKVKHLTVEGGGNIDGMGQEWWARSCKVNRTNPCHHAPTALTFHKCNNLKVRNIKLLNSQQMHLVFTDCKHVAVSKLVILAPADSPNTDAIHISSCTKVNVKDCTIGTGDDCISIVGNSSRIKVNNIVCAPGHGISIGSLGKSNSWGQVYNVHVNGAFISNTENGVRIKTWQGGSGYVRKVTFKNVWMENVSNPIIIDQYYCDSMEPCANQTSNIGIDKVSFVGIKGTSATEKAITIACSDSFPCRKLYLEDVQLTSFSGDYTTSFCWQAYGSTSGLNYPPPCFPCNDNILRPTVSSNWIRSI
ncbi:putative polygalacturonase [Capsicum annuum]|uniref:endo-polygalacturonase n=1 Tax=Capsicum annuum TaxID=4072 RepID=A0A1U8FUL7_CAPAN|nr:probable polygalacturonase At1g80170 [Capsicum annuum]KAF3680715.1 putative polygalacturonase [Capsicum annuum]PHT88400.1 putative polygalacturonase [Capsicum annuum]